MQHYQGPKQLSGTFDLDMEDIKGLSLFHFSSFFFEILSGILKINRTAQTGGGFTPSLPHSR
jgi:hypothetical protein